MIGMGEGFQKVEDLIVLEGRGVEQTTGRPEGWTVLEPAHVGNLPLAVLPVPG